IARIGPSVNERRKAPTRGLGKEVDSALRSHSPRFREVCRETDEGAHRREARAAPPAPDSWTSRKPPSTRVNSIFSGIAGLLASLCVSQDSVSLGATRAAAMTFDYDFRMQIGAPRPVVFERLLRIEHLSRWFCGWCRIDPKVGGAFKFGGEACIIPPE